MTTSALPKFQGIAGWLSGLKTFLLSLLALWYALAAVSLVEEMTGTGRYHASNDPEGLALKGLSACLVLGAMGAWSKRRHGLLPGVAAAIYLVLEVSRLASWPASVNWLNEVLPMAIAFSAWAGLSIAVSLMMRRWLAPMLHDHRRLRLAVVAIASVCAGLTVLLQPHKLQLFLNLFLAFWPDDWPFQDNDQLVLYYALGGMAAGFTLRLLWPATGGLPPLPAFALAAFWCALAARTLLDPVNSRAWLDQMPEPSPLALLLLPILAALLMGIWLARWPSRWTRHAS